MPDQPILHTDDERQPSFPIFGPKISLSRENERIILKSTAWRSIPYQLFVACLLVIVILMSVTGWISFFNTGHMTELAGAVIATVSILFGIWTLIDSFYSRHFEFDLDLQRCLYTHIPGMGLSIPLQDIEAIDFLKHWSGGITIGLALQGSNVRIRIHQLINESESDDITRTELKQLNTIFVVLGQILDVPMRNIEKATTRMNSWR